MEPLSAGHHFSVMSDSPETCEQHVKKTISHKCPLKGQLHLGSVGKKTSFFPIRPSGEKKSNSTLRRSNPRGPVSTDWTRNSSTDAGRS